MSENVTLLTDESIGGLRREYREVKRKANVGERIKYNGISTVYEVLREPTRKDDDCLRILHSIYADSIGKLAHISKRDLNNTSDYVVLVPSDIVRINDVRYRLEQRKANVGEIVVRTVGSDEYAPIGETFRVEIVYPDGSGIEITAKGEKWALGNDEYRVLSELKTVHQPLSSLTAGSQRDEIIANLARRVSALEAEVTALKRPAPVSTAAQIGEAVAKLAGAERKVPELTQNAGDVIVKRPATYEHPRCLPPLARDAVIERAKRDVADLTAMEAGYSRIKFVVNREKRTVVALRFYTLSFGEIVNDRGIAKCAPDDVFNSHIGRAIAVRRALGLAVPAEYTNAPKPTEVRVGDIVFYTSMFPRLLVTENTTNCYANPPVVGIDFLRTTTGKRTIDDSRDEAAE